LQELQGYNPLQLNDYAAFINALNGRPQNYHFLDVWQSGVQSPLLDMLNVRYIVVPRSLANRSDVQKLAEGRTIVYSDTLVNVYENPKAYDRAWIVHDVQQATDAEALSQLASGTADGHTVAFVNGQLPKVVAGDGPGGATESVTVTSYAPEKIVLDAHAANAGFMVLSEIYADGWRATVNGKSVKVYKTDGALRGVEIPAGESRIVMTYAPTSLRIGLAVSGVAGIAMLATFATAGWYALRRHA
ncbi:MAG TPA: YfhO family protein, partial [Thermomicrobiales bacterium]|nr:YfhO family protein [Thermomicrobiales bacterium]